MKILVIGDSHSNMFADVPGVEHQRSPGAFTARRFADPDFSEVWSWLSPWLSARRGADALVLSASEIDVRAHFWRHIPRAVTQGISLSAFITSKAVELLTAVSRVQRDYAIGRVVLWTAPPATDRTSYNPDWPFVGSVTTRNVLIHLFNCEVQRQIRGNPGIGLATGFYDYINPDSYLAQDHIPSDGVHWHNSLKDSLWNQHLLPVIYGQTVDLGPVYQQMSNHIPRFVATQARPTWLYDTWIRTEDLEQSLDTDPRASINGSDYSRIYLRDRTRFPDSYREMALVNQ